ncbi:hypothetical protein BDF22DRAFT_701296 [Syncephalis plumigaleata]|nr:hypothetical protein BDF22DRAFT_701296 [Syncephalis plumigaleata]
MLIKSISSLAIAALCLLNTVTLLGNNCVEASEFAKLDLFQSASPQCLKVLEGLDKKYDMLETCYPLQPLFFNTLPNICDPNCLTATISASQDIAKVCELKLNSPSPQHAYYLWSDKRAANAACIKTGDDNYCLQQLADVANKWLLRGISTYRGKSPQELLECNNPCMSHIYWSVYSESRYIPPVYLSTVPEPEQVFSAFEQHCTFTQ